MDNFHIPKKIVSTWRVGPGTSPAAPATPCTVHEPSAGVDSAGVDTAPVWTPQVWTAQVCRYRIGYYGANHGNSAGPHPGKGCDLHPWR